MDWGGFFVYIRVGSDHMRQADKWKRGLPYVGSKGQKADKIIDLLPSGDKLLDLFGGGVAYRLQQLTLENGIKSFITIFAVQSSSY